VILFLQPGLIFLAGVLTLFTKLHAVRFGLQIFSLALPIAIMFQPTSKELHPFNVLFALMQKVPKKSIPTFGWDARFAIPRLPNFNYALFL